MSLDNIKISPFLLKELYENNLVMEGDFKTPMPTDKIAKDKNLPAKDKNAPIQKTTTEIIKYLGQNEKNILLLVNRETHAFLDDISLDFLMTILNACGISMQDVALVNVHGNADAVAEKLNEQFTPSYIIFFDTAPHLLNFPIQIPTYKIQKYNNQQYLCASSLSVLANNKEEKKQLWGCLKGMFGI
jgi:hypothetical protein